MSNEVKNSITGKESFLSESSEWERVSQAFSECASVSLSAHLTPSQLQEDLRRHQITTGHPFVRPPSSTRFIIIKPQSALVSALIDQTNSTEPKNIGSRLANKLTKLKRYSSDSRLHCIRSTESSSSSSHTHSPCPSPSSSPGVYSLARISPTNASVSLSKRNPDSPAISAPNAPSTFSIERSPQFDSSANKARVAFELDYELETESSQPCDQQSLRVQLQHLRHFAHEFDLGPASPELDDQCAPLSNQASRSSSSLAFSNAAAVSATREKQCTCPQARAPPVIQSASILALQLPPSNQSLPSLTVPMPLPVNTGAANRQLCVNETSRPPSEMHLLSTGVASTGTVSHSRTFRPLAVRPVQPPPQHSHFRVVPAANPHSLRPSRTVPSLEALQRLNQWLPPSAESAGVGGGGTHRAPAPVALVPISRVPISVGRANASMQPTQIAPLPVATPSATPLLAYEYNYYPAVDYNSRPEIVPPSDLTRDASGRTYLTLMSTPTPTPASHAIGARRLPLPLPLPVSGGRRPLIGARARPNSISYPLSYALETDSQSIGERSRALREPHAAWLSSHSSSRTSSHVASDCSSPTASASSNSDADADSELECAPARISHRKRSRSRRSRWSWTSYLPSLRLPDLPFRLHFRLRRFRLPFPLPFRLGVALPFAFRSPRRSSSRAHAQALARSLSGTRQQHYQQQPAQSARVAVVDSPALLDRSASTPTPTPPEKDLSFASLFFSGLISFVLGATMYDMCFSLPYHTLARRVLANFESILDSKWIRIKKHKLKYCIGCPRPIDDDLDGFYRMWAAIRRWPSLLFKSLA